MNTGYVYSPVATPVADVSEMKNEENNPKTSSLCPTTTSMSHLPAAPQRRRFNSSSGPARRFKASHVFALFYLLYVVLYVSPSFQSSPNRPALDRGYVCCQPPRVASPPCVLPPIARAWRRCPAVCCSLCRPRGHRRGGSPDQTADVTHSARWANH